jgi:hypothetical protein
MNDALEVQRDATTLTAVKMRRAWLPVIIIKHDRRFKNDRGVHEAVETEALSHELL